MASTIREFVPCWLANWWLTIYETAAQVGTGGVELRLIKERRAPNAGRTVWADAQKLVIANATMVVVRFSALHGDMAAETRRADCSVISAVERLRSRGEERGGQCAA